MKTLRFDLHFDGFWGVMDKTIRLFAKTAPDAMKGYRKTTN